MSRRKQKFPSHITDEEGDGANCQKEHEKISSAVDERDTQELLLEVDGSQLIEHTLTKQESSNVSVTMEAPPKDTERVKSPNNDVSFSSSNSNDECLGKYQHFQARENSLVKVVDSHPTLLSYGVTYRQQQCHGVSEPLVPSPTDKTYKGSLSVTNTDPISYCSVPSTINSANIFSAKSFVFSFGDATSNDNQTLCQSKSEVRSSASYDKCHKVAELNECRDEVPFEIGSCHELRLKHDVFHNNMTPERCHNQTPSVSFHNLATPERCLNQVSSGGIHNLISSEVDHSLNTNKKYPNLIPSAVCPSLNVGKELSPEGNIFCEVSSSSSEENGGLLALEDRKICSRISEISFKCPVCDENFKSKRSFNSHILIHCQLVKSPASGSKRSGDESLSGNIEKKRLTENNFTDQSDINGIPCVPLDLSYKKREEKYHGSITPSKCQNLPPSLDGTPVSNDDNNFSVLSDRSPLEDENENLVNEAREHEKAFFDHAQNELFLTEDSTMLEPPPPLPLYNSGGIIRRVRVGNDDGPPMVYRVKIYAEQIFASRILGMNEETGDKIELYKCFMCSLSFPSVSRLQAHLTHHKQRFVCSKCSYSCDSRVQFSHHVQKKHIVKEFFRNESQRMHGDSSEDSSNAENTVTVAALLSALHGSTLDRKNFHCKDGEERRALSMVNEEQRYLEDSLPASPSPESQSEVGKNSETSSPGGDLFKLFSCRYCGKKFDRAFSCNRHERVHTGFKPCFCRICGRGFSEPRNLRHHVIRFHSDGSLRHLIKRDRRKRKDDDSNTPPASPTPPKDILRESCNMSPTGTFLTGNLLGLKNSPVNGNHSNGLKAQDYYDNSIFIKTDTQNEYASNLTEMFAASLEHSHRSKKLEKICSPKCHDSESHPLSVNYNDGALLRLCDDSQDHLEPGEIRLDLRTKIIDDGERGRRLVVAEDKSEDGLDHSPQFSAYAPRLDIVQEPVKRDKALTPITDDIGRTFYECPYCYKFFGSTSDLNRHLDFHEDLRPYDCKYCEYSARTNSQLKVHKMRHEGIKQFSCDVCNYNGVTQSDLNRHKKTQSHIARNQNVCPVCGLGFYSSSQKKVHIVKCHPEMEGASSLIQMSLGFPATSRESSPLPNETVTTAVPPNVNSTTQSLPNGLIKVPPSNAVSSHTPHGTSQKSTLVSSQQVAQHFVLTPNGSPVAVTKCEAQHSPSFYALANHSSSGPLMTSSGPSSNMTLSSIMVSSNI